MNKWKLALTVLEFVLFAAVLAGAEEAIPWERQRFQSK